MSKQDEILINLLIRAKATDETISKQSGWTVKQVAKYRAKKASDADR